MCLAKKLIGFFPIDIFISYGIFIGFFPLLLGVLLLVEDFIPSFVKYKVYKAKKEYVKAVKLAIRNSKRLSYNITAKKYKDFLLENPKYL